MTSQENYENNANLSPCDHHIPLSRGIYLESLGERVTKVTKENAVLLLSASENLNSFRHLRTPHPRADHQRSLCRACPSSSRALA
jgi:hypothetical protein